MELADAELAVPKENPQFDMMSETARDVISTWTHPPETLGEAPLGGTFEDDTSSDQLKSSSKRDSLSQQDGPALVNMDPAEQDIGDVRMQDVADHDSPLQEDQPVQLGNEKASASPAHDEMTPHVLDSETEGQKEEWV